MLIILGGILFVVGIVSGGALVDLAQQEIHEAYQQPPMPPRHTPVQICLAVIAVVSLFLTGAVLWP